MEFYKFFKKSLCDFVNFSKNPYVFFYRTPIIYNNFNEMVFRTDNGALFENNILLEIMRNRKAGDIVNFYRTQSGTEVDFVVDGATRRFVVECKYKRYTKTVNIPAVTNFADEENFPNRYIANIDLDATSDNGIRFVPAFAIDRVL